MKILFAIVIALLLSNFGHSQVVQQGFVYYVSHAPSGSCSSSSPQQNVFGTGAIYTCQNGTWGQIASGSGLPAGGTTPSGVPQFVTETPSGGVQGTATWALSGVIPRASTCTANADTILVTDRAGYVTENDASACTVTLPQAGTSGFANNFMYVTCDIGAGTSTITPTTSTISYTTGSAYTSGASSMPLTTGQCAAIYSDNTNYFAIQFAGGGSSLPDITDTAGVLIHFAVGVDFTANNSVSGTNPQFYRKDAASICMAGQGDVCDVQLADTYGTALGTSLGFGWSGTADASASKDTSLSRISAAYVGVGTGTPSNTSYQGGIIANKGFNIVETSTATIGTLPAPVKADTANANQVVVTTTTDTAAGLVIGVGVTGCAAASTCVITTNGVQAMTLGTGTCAIGNFVIVDTTTNGRVKCTGTYTAGTVIGVALAADSSVGTTFNVLIGLR